LGKSIVSDYISLCIERSRYYSVCHNILKEKIIFKDKFICGRVIATEIMRGTNEYLLTSQGAAEIDIFLIEYRKRGKADA